MPIPRFKIDLTPGEMLRCLGLLVSGSGNAQVERFEREIATLAGRRLAVAFPSGRMALYAVLLLLDISREKREILIPAFTVPEVVSMVRAAGWKPIFADAHPSRYNVDADVAGRSLSASTSAILMTHLFGQPSDVDGFMELAAGKKLILLEDAAQALGAECGTRRAGSFGLASMFSFGLVKNLTTLGGGMVATDDENLAEGLRALRDRWAMPGRLSLSRKLAVSAAVKLATSEFVFGMATYPTLAALDMAGSNLADRAFDEDTAELAMTDIPVHMRVRYSPQQASWGLLQLGKLAQCNRRRRENALFLREQLEGTTNLGLPEFRDGCTGIHLNFAVRHGNPAMFIKRLRRRGVDTTIGYLDNCADSPLFPEYRSDCPVASALERELFYLPVYPSLGRSDMLRIADAVRKTCDETP